MGSWTLTASISRASTGQQGVIFNRGSTHSGVTIYIKDNRLHCDYHAYDDWTRMQSQTPVPEGDCVVGVSMSADAPNGPGMFTLEVDGETVGSGESPILQRQVLFAHGECDIGADRRSPVGDNYDAPFKFQGEIHAVDIEVRPFEGNAAFEAQREHQPQTMSGQ